VKPEQIGSLLECITLKPARDRFRHGWQEAMAGETMHVSEHSGHAMSAPYMVWQPAHQQPEVIETVARSDYPPLSSLQPDHWIWRSGGSGDVQAIRNGRHNT